MSSSEKPNTWTDDPEQEVSKKRKSHAALSARSPEKNWDSEWYKKQKTCVGYIIAYITNLHKRPGLFPKKKKKTHWPWIKCHQHYHINMKKITELSRQKGPKGNRWKLRTIDDFPIELSIPHNPLGILHQKESFFFSRKQQIYAQKSSFLPRHIWLTAIGKHTRKKKYLKLVNHNADFFLMPLGWGRKKDWYTGSKGNDRMVQDNTQKHQFCWVEGGYILQQEHGNHRGTQSKKSDSNFVWESTKIDSKRFRNGV